MLFETVSRSLENQCWRQNNFLLTEEKFKFLVHAEDGVPWLASTDQEVSKLVENVTKAGGLYPDESFTILTHISVQCEGSNKWRFSSTAGSASRFPAFLNGASFVIIFQPQLSGCKETSPQVKVELKILS